MAPRIPGPNGATILDIERRPVGAWMMVVDTITEGGAAPAYGGSSTCPRLTTAARVGAADDAY